MKSLGDFMPTSLQIPEVSSKDQKALHNIASPKDRMVHLFQCIYDPELPISVWDLGLIYHWSLTDTTCQVSMTLTAPTCPVAQALPQHIARTIQKFFPTILHPQVDVVFSPPWSRNLMTEKGILLWEAHL